MRHRVFLLSALLAGLLASAGCYSLSQPVPEPAVVKRPLPFPFEILAVPNGCFVEAVRFHDAYCAKVPEGKDRWVNLFQFGSKMEDNKSGPGHSVTVYQWQGRLYYYDVNQGVIRLPLAQAQRADVAALAPHVYRFYRDLHPVGQILLSDVWQLKKPGRHDAPAPIDTEAYRLASRVADELGKVRATRVMRFSYLKDGRRTEGAAAVFTFEGRLCLYLPEFGTSVELYGFGTMQGQAAKVVSVDNYGLIYQKLRNAYGPAAKVELILPDPKAK